MPGTKKWQHLKIPFKDIEAATKNFQKCIGKRGYGLVYEGELDILGKDTKVAVKRLNEHIGQGLKDFLTEIEFCFLVERIKTSYLFSVIAMRQRRILL